MKYPPEPTTDQIEANAEIKWDDEYGNELSGVACWYPQMGGFSGRAVLHPHENGCFDVYVWHDGEFPFTGDCEPDRKPARLHHCDYEQFIEFGQLAAKFCDEAES